MLKRAFDPCLAMMAYKSALYTLSEPLIYKKVHTGVPMCRELKKPVMEQDKWEKHDRLKNNLNISTPLSHEETGYTS